jgi:hypothetical protein
MNVSTTAKIGSIKSSTGNSCPKLQSFSCEIPVGSRRTRKRRVVPHASPKISQVI